MSAKNKWLLGVQWGAMAAIAALSCGAPRSPGPATVEIVAAQPSEASPSAGGSPSRPRVWQAKQEQCPQEPGDFSPCDDRSCRARTGSTPLERDCHELFWFDLGTRDELASLCILMHKAWTIDGLVKFNDVVRLESPEVEEAYQAYRAALLDEARAIRVLDATRQEGAEHRGPAARRQLLERIDKEEQARRRLGRVCLP